MKSEKESAVFTDWAIELFDGALHIQREFTFACENRCVAFTQMIGTFVKCPNILVSTAMPDSREEPSARISIQILPERSLLAAAGEIAAICEHEYSLVSAEAVEQSAA